MARSTTRRIVSATAVGAVAAGFVIAVGVGSAGAAPGTVTWSDGNSKFTRTISNSTPSVGETVTVSTKFERTGGVVEWLQAVKDLHPTCLTYVSGNTGGPEVAPDYVRVTGNWPVYPNISPKSQTFEFNYLVTANCARATPLMTTMHYSGSLGSGTYQDQGPTITVAKDATTTTLAAVPAPVQVGQSVTLSATVTGGAQGDSVDFYDGGTKIGSGQLNASGLATFAWTASTAGARSLQAKYPGSARANASDSAVQSVTVSVPDVATSTTVQAPATAQTGTAVTLTATVTPPNASGTVQFKDNGTNIGSPVAVASGTANLQHTFLTGGSHSITADFVAGSGFVNSSASAQTVNVSVPDVATTTTVTVPAAAQTGTEVTLTADVTPNPGGGTVQFQDNGTNIGDPVTVSNGKAQLPHSFSTPGAHSITAVFSGSAGFTGSTSTAQSVTVSAPDVATTTTLTVPPTAETGQQVTLTANLDPTNASGTVQFQENGTNIGSPVAVSNGAASLQYTFTTPGSHGITAVFAGNQGFTSSTAAAQTVTVSNPVVPDVSTTTTLSVPATAVKGTTTTLTATVNPTNASGTVQFLDGQMPIGSPVTVTNGSAALQYSFQNSGNHSISAVFTGGAGFLNSTASAESITVTDPVVPDVTTTTTLTVPATAETGQQVTLTANLDPANAAGSVQFKDGSTNIGGPVAVSDGKATAQTAFTSAGQHSITAVFTGNTGFKSSTSTAQTVTVGNAVVQTTLTVSAPSTAQTGSAVTLSAVVSPANASGTVQFTDGGSNIGAPVQVTGGAAGLQHTFTAGGAHTIGATFTAAAGFTDATASTQTVQVSVPAPDDVVTTTTATAPATATVGQSVTLSATVGGGQNLPGTVQFYDGDTPIGGNVVLVNGVATLEHTFTTDGAHLITARYSGGQGAKASVSPAQTVQVTAGGGGDGGETGSVGSLGTMFGSLGGR
ncbi:beta strand repeat-containing protein [Rhodococcus sp. ACT016]|uniref:beta strand repeat-containing protein n=1 Tax=Rhodococcus sp. ACT016 TaxID=3134808 RepID=UPI003D2D9312